MESVIKTNDLKREIKYPMLMTAHGDLETIVVLFHDKCRGTVVYSERKEQPIGYYTEVWSMSGFTPFNETIELTNN